ncbi:oligosaccharide flippase family protein [Flavobacterium psychrophilum]|nr:oligosaccharide flippase family protein [Flavobacterium psychrophilum]EKT3964229.1 oligosaccharide flippase family protein [Flavobacterium psychrophilum]EKT4510165.1 oligosaccharide flippase family protein [Flavobacterium psychrophilum]EKT4517683.1 oligosaccharide flippase family protein [Flavobacterium psychrophilum]
MSENNSSYRQILKATSLFGGVQLFNILIAVLRTKLIAILIGPIGIGITGLLNSTTELIAGFTNFGLQTSATKKIAESVGNDLRISKIVTIVNKLVWFTGILGFCLTLFFSNWLSQITFHNSEFAMLFIWASFSLLLKQMSNGKFAILQGLMRLKYLAKANFYGSFLGLIITIPVYYYWKLDAIAPSIFISSLIGYSLAFYYTSKLNIKTLRITNQEMLIEARSMLNLGIMISLSSAMTFVSAYLLQIFINRIGGIEQVGFYNAGFTILNSYVALIFTAMSTDYFPRLTTVINDRTKTNKLVFEQASISILIITPIITFFLYLASFIINILYSKEFIVITEMISWGIIGMLFKSVSLSMGFILIAKGDSKIFIRTAIFFNTLSLVLNITAYYFYGLEGLGVSFLVYYGIHFYGLKILTKNKYNFSFNQEFYNIFLICITICFISFTIRYIKYSILKSILMVFMFLASSVFSLYQLNKKLDLKEIINSLREKLK